MFKLVLILFFSFTSLIVQAQQWVVFDPSNSGLPSYGPLCVAVDSNDVKWIASGGLNRFYSNNWINYNATNSPLPNNRIHCIAIDGSNNKWIATEGGIAVYNGTMWTLYNSSNSPLPSNLIFDIAIDKNNFKWIATYLGLFKFDGTNWTIYNTSNSGLTNNFVKSVAIEKDSIVWIGTRGGGLCKFTGSVWTTFDTTSGVPSNVINTIAVDKNNIKWIGCDIVSNGIYGNGGIASYNDTTFTKYDSTNSTFKENNGVTTILSIKVDRYNNKWIGTEYYGVHYFNNQSWTIYNSVNSGLPDDIASSISYDKYNNKWIATSNGGIGVFNETGVVSIKNSLFVIPKNFSLSQNYPNPFNPSTTISFQIPKNNFVILKVFDINGREISQLVNENLNAGEYKINFDGSSLPSGVYYYKLKGENFSEVKKMVLVK